MKSKLLIGLAAIIISCTTNRSVPLEYIPHRLPNGQTVHISNYVSNRAAFFYQGLSRELPLCLEGHEISLSIYVKDVDLPYYFHSDSVSSSFNPEVCNPNTYIGIMHNHPNSNQCGISLIDYQRFMNDEKAKVEIIVCNIKDDGAYQYMIFAKPPLQDINLERLLGESRQ